MFNISSTAKDYITIALEIMEIYLSLSSKIGLKDIKSALEE